MHAAAEPRRQELLRRLNLAPGGTAALVRMREQLLDAIDRRDDLAVVDRDFVHMFSSWFNRGFLVLRRIDWSTPASVLEKIIRYEAVHRIRGWDDLRRRIDPPDRRCYAFFHPALVDEPLIFVEVALTRDIPSAIAPDPHGSARADCGGEGDDRGVLLDLELPARADRRVVRPFPDQAGGRGDRARNAQAVDLRDAVAGAELRRLAQARARGADIEGADGGRSRGARQSRHARLVADREDARGRARAAAAAAAWYFLHARSRTGSPVDAVARFHLGNGARLERLNWLGDGSERAIEQAHGLMVNYLYDLDDIEKNHEAYAQQRTVIASKAVTSLARTAARDVAQLGDVTSVFI